MTSSFPARVQLVMVGPTRNRLTTLRRHEYFVGLVRRWLVIRHWMGLRSGAGTPGTPVTRQSGVPTSDYRFRFQNRQGKEDAVAKTMVTLLTCDHSTVTRTSTTACRLATTAARVPPILDPSEPENTPRLEHECVATGSTSSPLG